MRREADGFLRYYKGAPRTARQTVIPISISDMRVSMMASFFCGRVGPFLG